MTKLGGAVFMFMGALLLVGTGCSKGACVQTFDDGKTHSCTHMTKSACEQGKGDKYVGGECKLAGYGKKDPKVEDLWEK